MCLGNDPDRELVRICRAGTKTEVERGFVQVYEKYQARIYNLAFRITNDPGAAGDVVQETFTTIFQKLGSFRGKSLFSSWLTRIGINFALERKRKDSRIVSLRAGQTNAEDDREEADVPDPRSVSPDRSSIDREFEAEVHSVIHSLSKKYQTVVLLRYVEGLPYEEIAETLGCSVGTVKSRLNRAHRLLEGSLAGLAQTLGFRLGEPDG